MIDKVYSMFGLCMKAGMLAYGSDMCEEKIKYNKVHMIIVAQDASDNTKQRFKKLCKNDIAYEEYGTIDEIGRSIGKPNKAVIGIMNEDFSKNIKKLLVEKLKGASF